VLTRRTRHLGTREKTRSTASWRTTAGLQVLAIVHDPHYFWHAAQRLDEDNLPTVEWQHKRMAGATRTLHEVAAHGRLRHGGDQVARQPALAADVKEREYGLILSKSASRDPIDCITALAMAVEIAMYAEQRRSVYEDRYALFAAHDRDDVAA
jgi:phage terminase large subunit-like protein